MAPKRSAAAALFRDENLLNNTNKGKNKNATRNAPSQPAPSADEDLLLESSDEGENSPASESSEVSIQETADERRLRLGREYIKNLEDRLGPSASANRDGDDEENSDEVEDVLGHRLVEENREKRRILQQRIAASFKGLKTEQFSYTIARSQTSSVCCAAMSGEELSCFTGSKDSRLVEFDLTTASRVRTIKPQAAEGKSHSGAILSLAASEDGNFLASGDSNALMKIWDLRVPPASACVKTWSQHRGAITGLAFRMGSHDLYSASGDRTVKVWNLDQLAYVETLFGHQAEISCIDALEKPRAVTGGKDKTVRLWKIPEESQLLFRGPSASVDCVSLLNEEKFLTGSQDGSVSFWLTGKRKPAHTIQAAHKGEWITSVATQRFSDLAFSGSSDGLVQMYQVETEGPNTNKLTKLHALPVAGFVNALICSSKAEFLIAAVGQEHRLGRWGKLQEARNGLQIIKFKQNK